jgi:hypothetical protein
MGYQTKYTLVTPDVPPWQAMELIEKLRAECEEASYALCDNGSYSDRAKWYDHAEDMLEFSRKNPFVLFVLEGAGEETFDIWREYYRGGKMERVEANITFAEPKWIREPA